MGTCGIGANQTTSCCVAGHIETYTFEIDCSYYETVQVLQCSPCDISPADCRDEAEAELDKQVHSVNWQPQYTGYRQDVNDIREGVDKKGEPTIEVEANQKMEDFGSPAPADKNSKILWQTYTARYRYNLPTAWMDPTTGKVKYENEITAAEKSKYNQVEPMYVEDRDFGKQIQVGQYYIPFNATNDDLIKYNVLPNIKNDTPYSVELCSAIIDKYAVKSNDKPFWGDFIMHKSPASKRLIYDDVKTAEAAKSTIESEGGCRMGLRATFKIAQDYYSESGYNYYYRAIDYTRPFPNGMASNGFWYGRYNADSNSTVVNNAEGNKDTYNSQDLDNSFTKITYKTNSDYKTETIRNYNQASQNPKDNRVYSSWLEMNNNGTSKFISDGTNGVVRNGCQTFYTLGCGPANSDWKQCKITEVCH